MGRTLAAIGIAGTAAYLAGWAWLLFGRWTEISSMQLNNVGDLLAGVFGPLAILWLILGYFQQGIELRQNSAALRLQADELAHSVEQQKQMVQVARDQYASAKEALDFEIKKFHDEQDRVKRAAQPVFITSQGGSHSGNQSKHTVNITNVGAACTNVKVFSEDSTFPISASTPLLETGKLLQVVFTLPRIPPFDSKRVFVTYNDARGEPGRVEYDLVFHKGDMFSTAMFVDPADRIPVTSLT